jgi:hypothetical protein
MIFWKEGMKNGLVSTLAVVGFSLVFKLETLPINSEYKRGMYIELIGYKRRFNME